MTVSRVNAALAAALALGAALAAPPAVAQGAAEMLAQGAPVPLGPLPLPQPARPRDGQPAATAPQPVEPAGPPGSVIEVDRLGRIDPDSLGVLGDSRGGLGVDMWRGTPRALAARLIAALPAPLSSPGMRSLERRLVLTTATAPDGTAAEGPLLAHRVAKLVALGDIAAALELVRIAPPEAADERLARSEVEAQFFGNDNTGACARVRVQAAERREAYWQQALAYCLALSGENEQAALIADLLRERREEVPGAFFTLIEALGGDRNVRVDELAEPNALLLSMMRAANRKLPPSIAAAVRAAVLRAVALAPNADLPVRLDAAERALALGAITVQEMGEIYASVPFGAQELASPMTAAEAAWGPRGRALLLRAALGQRVPTARAEMVERALRLGREKGGGATVRRAFAPVVAAIKPAGELMWFAASAGQVLYGQGAVIEGQAWYAAVEEAAPTSQEAARAWIALWPLARIAARSDEPWNAEVAARWRAAALGGGADDAARARTVLAFALFESMGLPVAAEVWSGLIGGAHAGAAMPDPAVWRALDRAATDGRRAEAVGLALIALGTEGPEKAHPIVLATVVAALRRLGLEADARTLALEAVASGG